MNSSVSIQNGLRHVRPYYKRSKLFVKGRWVGKTVLEVLVKEFRTFDKDYYVQAIKNGRFKLVRKVRGDSTVLDPLTTVIKSGDILETMIHQHEPPVRAWKGELPAIVHEDESMLVVDKPCGIPVHPTGSYNVNSLTEVIKTGRKDITKLYPCHRLDKVTSGLTLLAKSNEMASTIQTRIQSHSMQKMYLARVTGKFPGCELGRDIFTDETRIVKNMSPIYTIQTKKQYPNGLSSSRDAETLFYPCWYDGDTDESLVICQPLTGRTHQIRIHLLRLGYPITNDTLYCPRVSKYPLYTTFMKDISRWEEFGPLQEKFDLLIKEATGVRKSKLDPQTTLCKECQLPLMKDPETLEDLTLYLHAWKYFDKDVSGENSSHLSFQTELPNWAKEHPNT